MNAGSPPHRLLERHRAMRARYGFGLFPLPTYREVTVGDWRVVRHLPSIADSYVSGPALESLRHVLHHRRTAWMSTGLMEQESHAFHVDQARGVVVAAGLGIGMYAYAVSVKPEVERVVVVERATEVIAIVKKATAFEAWPGRDKVAIVEADALDPDLALRVAAATGGRRPDCLYADIWPTCAAPSAPAETAAMVRALGPRVAGWWGQELSFGLWCGDCKRPPDESTLREYAAFVGVPIPVTPGYATFCGDAIAVHRPGAIPTWWEILRRLLRLARHRWDAAG